MWPLSSLLLVTAIAAVFLTPLYWMASGSFKLQLASMATPPELFPAHPSLANWETLFGSDIPALRWLLNSCVVAAGTCLVSVTLSACAGYAFGKKRFPGRHILFLLILSTMMIPSQVLLIPLYLEVRALGLYNTYVGLMLPMLVSPFGVFLMRQYVATIPNELMDAARIDGVSEWGMFTRLIVPLMRPAIAALAIFVFAASWNNFLWQLLIADNISMDTLPVGVAAMATTTIGGRTVIDVGLLMAGGSFAALPMILFFLLFQRHFVKGVVVGAVRG